MKIAIDLDGTIDATQQSVEFFRALTRSMISEHDIHIVTDREPGSELEIEQELSVLGIRSNKIVITGEKSQYIQMHGISVVFENTDEQLRDLPDTVCVFKIREDGNFDFGEKKWIGSRQTTKMID